MRCPQCGQEIAPGTAVCPYCRAQLLTPAPQGTPPPAGQPPAYYAPPKSSTGLIIGLLVGIPVALFAIAVIVIAVLVLMGPRISAIYGTVYNSLY